MPCHAWHHPIWPLPAYESAHTGDHRPEQWPFRGISGSCSEMSTTDPIGVLTSTRPVIDDAIWVEIDHNRVDVIALDFAGRRVEPEEWASSFHYNVATPRTATWVFVLDA